MPKTPQVGFKIINNNVESSVPLLGVTHVVARTTKGPFNDPSTLITGIEQFRRIFGEEVIDPSSSSVSSIEKALGLGSKLRISRVEGVSGQTKGTATNPLTVKLKGSTEVTQFSLTLETLYGGYIFDDSQVSKNLTINQKTVEKAGKIFINLENTVGENVLGTDNLINGGEDWLDWTTFRDYLQTANFAVKSVSVVGTLSETIKNLDALITWMSTSENVGIDSTTAAVSTELSQGSNGGDNPSSDMYIKAFKATQDYVDAYQVILPQACNYTFKKLAGDKAEASVDATGYNTAMKEIADLVVAAQEEVLYVEIPVLNADGEVAYDFTTDAGVKAFQTAVTSLQGTIGTSPYIAYFTGGLKYYNAQGNLVDSDVIGTVAGLGDASASNYGPWKSFAGMNRGVVNDAYGPVIANLGTPSKLSVLQDIADYSVNLFLIKDTQSQGKRTMLWHCFTSNPKSDSERFLSTVRLNLYIKKNLRPILESYLEDPNIWDTWQNIYFQGKPIMDNLVSSSAISEYTWMGDQDASSYDDLVVNTEADVRQGKYKLIIKYKDIVPIQDVQVTLTIDKASSTVTSEVSTSNV
jgi:hypothetical protein